MSRKKLKTLANLARAAGVFLALLAAGTAIVWSQFPGRVDAFEAWLHGKLVGTYYDAWAAARGEADPAPQQARLEALLERLDHVRKDDHLAEIVRDCHSRLANLARARGDLAGAIEWLRAAALFDDHDVAIAATLGDLLAQVPGKRQEGTDHLTQLAARFPAHPLVVPVLVRHLIAAGNARGALQVLDASEAAPRSSLWTVLWDAGAGFDAEARRAETVPIVDGELFRLRFGISPGWRRLRFVMPPESSCTLYAPKLTLAAGDVHEVIDVATACEAAAELLVARDRLEAAGTASPRFEIVLPKLPAGPVDVVLEARCQPNRSPLLAQPATAPEMAALADALQAQGATAQLASLQRWRLAALHGAVELFHRGPTEDFADTRRIAVASPFATAGDEKTFDVTLPVPAGTAEVRLDLPPFAGYRYRLTTIDPAALTRSGMHDLELQRDGVLLTTGTDPFLTFVLPASGLSSLRFAGAVR